MARHLEHPLLCRNSPFKPGPGPIANRNQSVTHKTGEERRIDRSQRLAAKVFAFSYLISFALSIFAFYRWYAPILVWDDPATTARNLVAHEYAFRIYLAFAFLHGVGGMVILVALYILLRPISRSISLLAALGMLVYVLMWFVSLLDQLHALRVMCGRGIWQGFDAQHLQALAGLQIASGQDAYYVGLTLLGMGTALFSYLLFRAHYVPQVLAGWGIVACLFEGICGCTYLLFPGFGAILSVNWYEAPALLFHVGLCAWLFVKGLGQAEAPKQTPARN
jgi:hypothetical protein